MQATATHKATANPSTHPLSLTSTEESRPNVRVAPPGQAPRIPNCLQGTAARMRQHLDLRQARRQRHAGGRHGTSMTWHSHAVGQRQLSLVRSFEPTRVDLPAPAAQLKPRPAGLLWHSSELPIVYSAFDMARRSRIDMHLVDRPTPKQELEKQLGVTLEEVMVTKIRLRRTPTFVCCGYPSQAPGSYEEMRSRIFTAATKGLCVLGIAGIARDSALVSNNRVDCVEGATYGLEEYPIQMAIMCTQTLLTLLFDMGGPDKASIESKLQTTITELTTTVTNSFSAKESSHLWISTLKGSQQLRMPQASALIVQTMASAKANPDPTIGLNEFFRSTMWDSPLIRTWISVLGLLSLHAWTIAGETHPEWGQKGKEATKEITDYLAICNLHGRRLPALDEVTDMFKRFQNNVGFIRGAVLVKNSATIASRMKGINHQGPLVLYMPTMEMKAFSDALSKLPRKSRRRRPESKTETPTTT